MSVGIRAGASPASIASKIGAVWRTGIADARMLSRTAGLARLRAELVSLGVPMQTARAAAEEAVRDALRARMTADAYAKRWLAAAEAEGPRAASATTLGRARVIAATESSEAYNSGRLNALRGFSSLSVMRVWDATLDKRVCPVCELADGTIVGVRESFPNGEPGSVHPNCRCTWQLVTLQESRNL